MRIEHLREFIVLARHLNFRKAARELYITQPALSNHIAGMEKELGFDLVQRGQRISLTPAGKIMFTGAENMLAEYDQVVANAAAAAKSKAGQLVFEEPVETTDINRLF